MPTKDKKKHANERDVLKLAGEFPPVAQDAWRAMVERLLKGDDVEDRMTSRTYDDIEIRPLYTAEDWSSEGDPSGLPGAAPFTRGHRAAGTVVDGWGVRQLHVHPDRKATNAAILDDLANGVRSLQIRLARATDANLDFDQLDDASPAGVYVSCLDDLDESLSDVDLSQTPIGILGEGSFLPAAAALAALWRRRRVSPDAARGAFNCDPFAVLASTGRLYAPLESVLGDAADLAAFTDAAYPHVTSMRVDGAVYHNAGASEAQEIACAVAGAVAYLRTLTDAGMAVERAFGQIPFATAVDADFFLSIAKIRALRRLWGRVAEACGVAHAARAMRLQAETSKRMMARRDPWVNMLRTTVSCFAAAMGGADEITVMPFDAALRLPDGFARRIARNTQHILQEESALSRVIDPAGGAWAIESLTDALARHAWDEFQAIERAGGLGAVLQDGSLAAAIDEKWTERENNIAKLADPVIGVSDYPDIFESPIAPVAIDRATLRKADAARLTRLRAEFDRKSMTESVAEARAHRDGGLSRLVMAMAEGGATLGCMTQGLSEPDAAVAKPLPRRRLGAGFEALRDASDAYRETAGARPNAFLAGIGSLAEYGDRMTFARNALAAGGIESIDGTGGMDPAAIAAEYKGSDASVVVICSTDDHCSGIAPKVADALKAAGAREVVLAAAPELAAGSDGHAAIDGFLYSGCDLRGLLTGMLDRMGVLLR